jgi:putative ABC transport system permease protein
MNALWQDLKFGARMLAKSPALTAIVVLTLALGIGANTAIFGIVDGSLLRPLPVRNPEQIVVLAPEQKGVTLQTYFFSYPDLLDYRKQVDQFSDLFATYSVFNFSGLSADGKADHIVTSYVTGNYFSALGLQAAAGRLFFPGEGEKQGEAPVLVLGYSYWQRRFGGDSGVVGKQVLVDGSPATIIGVGPKGFTGVHSGAQMDAFLPMNRAPGFEQGTGGIVSDRGARLFRVLGRLKPGASLAQAQTSVNVVAARLAQQYPASDKDFSVHVVPETRARPDPIVSNVVPVIAGSFLALAALVLLLACMNVANVLMVRATVRQHEMGIRAALGAGRRRLILQVLTESILLALLGGVAGMVLREWTFRTINSAVARFSNPPVHPEYAFDWTIFLYTLAIALFTGSVVGIWPALRASRADVNAVLREGGRADAGLAGHHRVRNVLVVGQLAGSLVLLIVAGLFVRSLMRLERSYLGFDPENVLNVTMDPHGIGYNEPRTKEFYRALEARVRALPGVQSVTLALSVPMETIMDARFVHVEGHPLAPGQQPPLVTCNRVDPSYFGTMRVPLLRGRGFAESDSETAPQVVVVNQAMAARFWPNQDPIGKRVSFAGPTGPWVEVVGVAVNGKYFALAFGEPIPYLYLPLAQSFSSQRTLQIRSTVPPESLIASVQQEIQGLAPDLPVFDVQTMKQALGGTNGLFVFRMGASLAGAMGLLGLVLAVVGIYGVVSFTAAQRTHEIGIRIALGAERRDILRLVLRQGMGLVIAGVLGGLIAAWALTRVMARLFIGVSATDPLTFAGVTLLLAAIALWACYLPARRATRVDPMVALRYE